MIRSMTGFGSARIAVVPAPAALPAPQPPSGPRTASATAISAFLVLELRATNHKYSEVRLTAPRELAFLAGPCEARIRGQLERGAVDARLTSEGEALTQLTIDVDRVRAAHAALTELANELTPGMPIPVQALLSLPDLFVSGAAAHRAELEAAAAMAVDAAVADLFRMQEVEGKALAEDMAGRLQRIDALAAEVAERQPAVLVKRRARLLAKLEDLLRDARSEEPRELSRLRVEQEIVLLADKYDTTEEKTRLGSHVAQCLSALGPAGNRERPAPAGKRLDFLLQEISREISTMGAKSEDAEIAQLVIDMKTEAAKLREQVQNIV